MSKQQSGGSVPLPMSELEVKVPSRKSTHAYKTNHIDVQLNRSETERMADIFSGLQRDGATVRGGKLVTSPNLVLVWLLENMKEPVQSTAKE